MLDGVFHHRLQQHAGNKIVEGVRSDFFKKLKFVRPEANHFNVQVVVDKFELVAQRDEGFRLAQQAAKNVREFDDCLLYTSRCV